MRASRLSLRMALLVGLLGLLQAAGVLLFAYVTLEHELDAQKRVVLRDKEDQTLHLLSEMPNAAAIRESAPQLVELVKGHAELHIAIGAPGRTEAYVASSDEAMESLSRLKSDTWGTAARRYPF